MCECLASLSSSETASMLQGKRSPLGKPDPSRDIDSQPKSSTLSGQQQILPAVSQTADFPVSLTAADSTLAASSRQLQPPLPNKLVASGKQASLQQSSLASHQAPTSLTLPSTRQSGSASTTAQPDVLMAKQLSSASAKAGQLTGSGSAVSPRQRRDPSPAELAFAKQQSLAAGAAVPVAEDTQAFVPSPRQKRDPSPAELGLIRHQSDTSKVLHNRQLMYCSGTMSLDSDAPIIAMNESTDAWCPEQQYHQQAPHLQHHELNSTALCLKHYAHP